MKPGLKKALSTFKWAAKKVPAYKLFLKDHKIDPKKIKTASDFNSVPYMDKKNYLRKYNFEDLFPDRQIPPMISSSSGSTGEPFYWPRKIEQEVEGGEIHYKIFRDVFELGNDKTLVIICFSMGTWIAGTYTTACCRLVAEKKKNLSIITPGIDKEDTLLILKKFAKKFQKIIIVGYPPFLMDIMHGAINEKISLEKLNIRFLFAGENFSEEFRETIHDIAGIKNPLKGSISIYGTADAAILGHESPLGIYIRKQAMINERLRQDLFSGDTLLPTVIQYYPHLKFFEDVNGELVFTTKTSGIPLIRYNIHDGGRIFSYYDIIQAVLNANPQIDLKKQNLDIWKQPFIFLSERSDVAVTFYALNIYVDNLKYAIEELKKIGIYTGKFTAFTKMVNNHKDQKLIICIELKPGTLKTKDILIQAQRIITQALTELNSEYRKLFKSIGNKALPFIELLTYGDKRLEITKAKHKWIKRNDVI